MTMCTHASSIDRESGRRDENADGKTSYVRTSGKRDEVVNYRNGRGHDEEAKGKLKRTCKGVFIVMDQEI